MWSAVFTSGWVKRNRQNKWVWKQRKLERRFFILMINIVIPRVLVKIGKQKGLGNPLRVIAFAYGDYHSKSLDQLTWSLLKKKPCSVTIQEQSLRGPHLRESLEASKASNLFLVWSHFMVHLMRLVLQRVVRMVQLKSSCSCRALPPRSASSEEHHITNGTDELFRKPFITLTEYSDPIRLRYSPPPTVPIIITTITNANPPTTKVLTPTFMLLRTLIPDLLTFCGVLYAKFSLFTPGSWFFLV